MELELLPSLALFGIGIIGALLGISGRVRYSGRASCAVIVLIVVGLWGIVSSIAGLLK